MRYQSVGQTVRLLGCAFGFVAICAQQTFASAEALAQVTEIFGAVDGSTAKATPGESAYARLQKLKPAETAPGSVRYAYLLGLLELHKQRDALAYAGELVQHDPNSVRCRLLRARLSLGEKKFPEAFADLEAAGGLLAERTKKETLDAETEAACRALGLMFGYLEGPAKPLVKATLGAGVKDRLLANFSVAAKKVFQDQYDAVLAEQKALVTKGEAAFRQVQQKHQQELDAAADRRAKLEEKTADADKKKQDQIDDLKKQWETARADYDKQAAAYSNLMNSQAQLANQRSLLANQAAVAMPRDYERDSNGNIRAGEYERYNRENQRYQQLVDQVNAADQQILRGTNQLQQMWNQGNAAEAGLRRLQAQGERLGVEFAMKERAFEKQKAGLDRNDPSKKKLPPAPTKRLEQSFSQYDDFNYAQEKQKVLDYLRTAK
jgi:hypothetical protein